jgi:hypothetical protein
MPPSSFRKRSAFKCDDVVNYVFPRTWPSDREQRARIIEDCLRGSPISGLKMANFSTFFEFVLTGVAAGTVAIALGVLLGSGNRRK